MKYDDIQYEECKNVYPPAEDTFMLIDNLKIKPTDKVLEIGVGSGIVSIKAAKKASHVTSVDINPDAIKCAKNNMKLNNITNMDVKISNLFENIDETYDVILFNTPYLPVDEMSEYEIDDDYSKAWDGGSSGRDVIDQFLKEAPEYLNEGGLIQLIQSSLSDNEKTLNYLNENGFNAEIGDLEHVFFEDITLINAQKIK